MRIPRSHPPVGTIVVASWITIAAACAPGADNGGTEWSLDAQRGSVVLLVYFTSW